MAYNTAKAAHEFRGRLRAMHDKRWIRKRELLGLLMDVYELVLIMDEEYGEPETSHNPFSSLMGRPDVLRVDEATFDKILKSKQKSEGGDKGLDKESAHVGQYL